VPFSERPAAELKPLGKLMVGVAGWIVYAALATELVWEFATAIALMVFVVVTAIGDEYTAEAVVGVDPSVV
jgi:hypothetical protein